MCPIGLQHRTYLRASLQVCQLFRRGQQTDAAKIEGVVSAHLECLSSTQRNISVSGRHREGAHVSLLHSAQEAANAWQLHKAVAAEKTTIKPR